jgi:hypothetical protein
MPIVLALKAQGCGVATYVIRLVRMVVLDVCGEYEARPKDSVRWLYRHGNTHKGVIDGKKIRVILWQSSSR